jgi:hypothetical protein
MPCVGVVLHAAAIICKCTHPVSCAVSGVSQIRAKNAFDVTFSAQVNRSVDVHLCENRQAKVNEYGHNFAFSVSNPFQKTHFIVVTRKMSTKLLLSVLIL